MDKVELGAKQTVEACAGVKPGDRVVVVKDKPTATAAAYVEKAIKNVRGNLQSFLLEDYGKRPIEVPPEILEAVKKADEAFICTDYIREELPIFWRPLAGLVKESPVKMAVMIDLDQQMLEEGMNADYQKIRQFSKKVYEAVKDAKVIKVRTQLGSDFVVELGYEWVILDGFPKPGKWVNLPDGEVLTAPTNVDGKVVIDGVIEEFDNWRFKLLKSNPLSVEIKDGYAVKGSIKSKNKDLEKHLRDNIFGHDENAPRVGEFAFGTNIYLKRLIGNTTQDEKFPSVHIAFGNPHGEMTGAPWESEIHMDAIVLKPTVWVDGEIIMREGRYLI